MAKEGAKKAKRGRGRPSRREKIDLERVRRMAALGMTDDEMAAIFGINERTIEDWKKFPDFLHALKEGKAQADALVVGRLYENAKAGDTTAIIFWLKNRQRDRWRDRTDHRIEGVTKLGFEFGGTGEGENGDAEK